MPLVVLVDDFDKTVCIYAHSLFLSVIILNIIFHSTFLIDGPGGPGLDAEFVEGTLDFFVFQFTFARVVVLPGVEVGDEFLFAIEVGTTDLVARRVEKGGEGIPTQIVVNAHHGPEMCVFFLTVVSQFCGIFDMALVGDEYLDTFVLQELFYGVDTVLGDEGEK